MRLPHSSFHAWSTDLEPQDGSGTEQACPMQAAADSAIDTALLTVPLPDGFMTRLAMLVVAMPEEPADRVDWLGC